MTKATPSPSPSSSPPTSPWPRANSSPPAPATAVSMETAGLNPPFPVGIRISGGSPGPSPPPPDYSFPSSPYPSNPRQSRNSLLPHHGTVSSRNSIPHLHSTHAPPNNRRSRRRLWLTIAAILVLVVAAAVVGGFVAATRGAAAAAAALLPTPTDGPSPANAGQYVPTNTPPVYSPPWPTQPKYGFVVPVYTNSIRYTPDTSSQNGEFLDSLIRTVANAKSSAQFLFVLNPSNGPGTIGTSCMNQLSANNSGFDALLNGLAKYKSRVKVIGYVPVCWGFDYVQLEGSQYWKCQFNSDPTSYPPIKAMIDQWASLSCTSYGALDGIFIDQTWPFNGFQADYARFFSKIRPLLPNSIGHYLATNPGYLETGIESWFRNDTNPNGFDLVGVVENHYKGLIINGSAYDRFVDNQGILSTVTNRSQVAGFVHATADLPNSTTDSQTNARNASAVLSRYNIGWWYITDNAYYSLPNYWDAEIGGCDPYCKTYNSTVQREANQV